MNGGKPHHSPFLLIFLGWMMATSHIIKLLLLMISLQLSRSTSLRRLHPSFIVMSQNKRKALSSTTDSSDGQPPPVYRAEGLMAVHKPLTWTSQDVGKKLLVYHICLCVFVVHYHI
jgi:hypothetical protein